MLRGFHKLNETDIYLFMSEDNPLLTFVNINGSCIWQPRPVTIQVNSLLVYTDDEGRDDRGVLGLAFYFQVRLMTKSFAKSTDLLIAHTL